MANNKDEYVAKIEKLRRERVQHYLEGRFDEGDRIKKLIEEMERHAASRGWSMLR